MTHILEDLKAFLADCPTSWHAVQEIGTRLAMQDFIPLEMGEKWQLVKGKKYFVSKDGSLIAFALPLKSPTQSVILGAHTDSPALKIKPNPESQKSGMIQLGVEVYGGPILASWLNRDLGIAGRVVTMGKDNRLQEQLVLIDDAPLIIPSLAIHLDREVNEKGLLLNKQDHLSPVAALSEEPLSIGYLEMLLRRTLSFHSLVSFDLFLYPLDPPRFIGGSGEMIAAYRLDNLASTHAAVIALGNIEKPTQTLLPMGAFWDHEEIGSETKVGADSSFFQDVWQRISDFYALSIEEEIILREHAICLSIDMAHALNPNYEKKYDPGHQPLMGKGIVLKYNASDRYATHAMGSAQVQRLCQRLNLQVQQYVSRSDIPSGTTIGPIFAKKMGIETVDLGVPQLSMHAAREVMCNQDYIDLSTLLTFSLREESR